MTTITNEVSTGRKIWSTVLIVIGIAMFCIGAVGSIYHLFKLVSGGLDYKILYDEIGYWRATSAFFAGLWLMCH